MSLLNDTKYIAMCGSRLERFKRRKANLYSFRCPVCGDSKKDKTKARGNFYEYKGGMYFNCYNGCTPRPFGVFLKWFDPVLYSEYRTEEFSHNKKSTLKYEYDTPTFSSKSKIDKIDSFFDELTLVENLPDIHPVKRYVIGRKLDPKNFYLTPKFKAWTNKMKSGTFKSTKYDTPRLIIPFKDETGKVFTYQGRSFDPKDPNKYITIKLDEAMPKIYGLDTVDKTKTVYMVEGPIDSMLLDNAVAASGSDIDPKGLFNDYVIIMDNEPRNIQIVKKVEKAVKSGEKVVIWGSEIPEEADINSLIMDGYSKDYIMNHIKKHTFQGLYAELEFGKWSRL